ncbi:MAG TPA: 3'-5' exonuclease [Rheinheimera sp.]|uniref:3'-5' exonuclease n=1 Tax=Rheinheimera sp. TaxID=1869214 RepID=UPI000EE7FBED|nr:3'-5' exonuclease [Rheinheimera sp.]HCU64580.1 3'-5' exonuclease [Rheinheimera sp.]
MTTLALFFDTETTGLPVWNEPSENPNQPHIVELAAKLVNLDTREVVYTIDTLVKPDGWVIPQEVIDLHGITNEMALEQGRPESEVLTEFMGIWATANRRVAHNQSFDERIMRIAIKRYLDEDTAESWKAGEKQCTGLITKPLLQLLPKNKFGFKMPKLSEAYEHFMGKPLENAHRAMADVDACIAVYFAVIDQQAAA